MGAGGAKGGDLGASGEGQGWGRGGTLWPLGKAQRGKGGTLGPLGKIQRGGGGRDPGSLCGPANGPLSL